MVTSGQGVHIGLGDWEVQTIGLEGSGGEGGGRGDRDREHM